MKKSKSDQYYWPNIFIAKILEISIRILKMLSIIIYILVKFFILYLKNPI